MTVTGRSQDTTEAIHDSDARLGVESSKDWLDGYTPQFVDFPFTDPDATFRDHLSTVKAVQPTLTVAPDIEGDRDPGAVFLAADELNKHAETVIVVPKSVPPKRIPERFRVGVPTADFGSGAGWSLFQYRDCGPVHVLGGGPKRQLAVGQHAPVASVDTSALGKVCCFGYWDGKSQDAPDGWDYKERLRRSLDNYAAVWNDYAVVGQSEW